MIFLGIGLQILNADQEFKADQKVHIYKSLRKKQAKLGSSCANLSSFGEVSVDLTRLKKHCTILLHGVCWCKRGTEANLIPALASLLRLSLKNNLFSSIQNEFFCLFIKPPEFPVGQCKMLNNKTSNYY